MLISPAFAQAGGSAFGGELVSFMPLILIFVVFWFFLIRPQQKRAKEHREMIGNLRRGDDIITGGGIFGKVTKVIDDNTLQVEISENVRIRVARSTVTDVVSKPDPTSANDSSAGTGGKTEKRSLFSFGSKK